MMREQCAKFEPDGRPSSVDVLLVGELRRTIASFNETAGTRTSGSHRSAVPSHNYAARVRKLQNSAAKFWNLAHTLNQEEYEDTLAITKVVDVRFIANPPFRSCDNGIHNLTFELSKLRPEYFAADAITYVKHATLTFLGSGGGSGRLHLGTSEEEHVVSTGGGTKSRHVHNTVYYRPRTASVRVSLQRYGWSVQEKCSHPLIMDGMNVTIGHTLNNRKALPYRRPSTVPGF
jgi:hypothetical protein